MPQANRTETLTARPIDRLGAVVLVGLVSALTVACGGDDDPGTPCAEACDQPPADECAGGDTLRHYDSAGSCVEGVCHYDYSDDVCATPPEDVCLMGLWSDNKVDQARHYAATGTCAAAACTYAITSQEDCNTGCASGACLTPCAVTTDDGNDGTVERTVTYAYDVSGHLVEQVATGGAPYRLTYTYDVKGNRVTLSADFGDNGSVDESATYTYNTNGQRATETFSGTSPKTFVYDAAGNLIAQELGGDVVVTYSYDADDLLTLDELAGADDIVRYRHLYSNSGGHRATAGLDYTDSGTTNLPDGTPDELHAYTYDATGNVATEGYDFDPYLEIDGVADTSLTYTRNGTGAITSYTEETRMDPDPSVTNLITYLYACD